MNLRANLVITAGFVLLFSACSTQQPSTSEPGVTVASGVTEGKDRVERSNVVTVTAVVEAVDVAKREVTVRGPEGNVTTIHVDDSVKNLPQIRKGDQVTVAYYESLAIQVRKPGEATVGDTAVVEGLETAKAGEKPGAVGARAATVVTRVEAIDKGKGTVTLKGPEGETKTIKAQNPANLDKIKVGDTVEITYTEALAISVDKP